jgi:hypothetical protein
MSKNDNFVKESKKKWLLEKNGVVRKEYTVKSLSIKSKDSSQFKLSSSHKLSLSK